MEVGFLSQAKDNKTKVIWYHRLFSTMETWRQYALVKQQLKKLPLIFITTVQRQSWNISGKLGKWNRINKLLNSPIIYRETQTYPDETYRNQCELFEWGESIVSRYNCIANITSTINQDGTVNEDKFHDLYSDTVLEGQMVSIKEEYENCATDAHSFYSDNQEMITNSWQTDRDAWVSICLI